MKAVPSVVLVLRGRGKAKRPFAVQLARRDFRSDISLGRFDPIPLKEPSGVLLNFDTSCIEEPEKKKEGEAEEMEEQEEKKK